MNKWKGKMKRKRAEHNKQCLNCKPVSLGYYLNVNGIFSFGGMTSPKKEASSAILHRTMRTISPKYIPEIIFSNI